MKNLWLFKNYLWAYKKRLISIFALIFLGAIFEGVGIGLFFPLIEYVQKGDVFLADKKFRYLSSGMQYIGIQPTVGNFIWIIFFVIFISLALRYFIQVVSALTYNPIMKKIRDDGFDKMINSQMQYFHSISSGKLVSAFEKEVEYVGQSLNSLIQITVNAVYIIVYGTAIFFISLKLSLVIVGIAIVRYKVLGFFVKATRLVGKENTQIRGYLNSSLVGIYQGIDVVKSYATEDKEIKRFSGTTGNLLRNVNRMVNIQAGSWFVQGLLGEGFLCFIIFLAIAKFNIPGSSIFVFLYIVTRIIPKVTFINDARIRLAEYTSGILYLKKIFENRDEYVQRWGEVVKQEFKDNITFNSVNFSYSKNGNFALKNVNLNIAKNESVALVGESGAGKTTFTRLFLRLYDPSSGKILIDGVSTNDLTRDSWKKLVSVVSQDTFVFDDTVKNNIMYSVDSCSDEEFWDTVRKARAEDFINELPEKEETKLGERGIKLSGGQRQRIAIARAFLRNSPILILDEATSSLDSVTESQIQEALTDLAKDRTIIVVAHRLSTIKNVDRIFVFDKGEIVESGTHAELYKNSILYKKYYELQVY